MAKNSTSNKRTFIFEVNDSHNHTFLATSMRNVFDRIAYALASDPSEVATWKTMDEFPGLDTPDLCGNWRQRVRFEAENAGRWFYVAMHDVSTPPSKDTYVKGANFSLTDEFDPSYEIQKSLYLVSLGEETVETASKALHDGISNRLAKFYPYVKKDEILKKIRAIHSIMGGQEVLPKPIENPAEFLTALPQICKDRFEELAARAFPQPSMTL